MKAFVLTATALLVATTSFTAAAQQQPWIADRQYGEGIGIRVGDLELHPGIAAEFGYDSNYFQRAEEENPIDTWRAVVTASASVSTLGPRRRMTGGTPKLTFRAGVFAAYNDFIAADSENQDAMSDQRHLDAGANFALNVLPQGRVGVDAYGDFVRSIEPSNLADTANAWDRHSYRLGAGVIWRPGGGLFDWRWGYELRYNQFLQDAFENLNNVHHQINTRGRFRFLPKTALIYDGAYTWIRYEEGAADSTTNNDAETIRSRVGVSGLVTNRFAFMALVGWSSSFYHDTVVGTEHANYDSINAHGEVRYFLQPQPQLQPGDATMGLSSVALGYVRDFNNSYLGNYYARDRVYANANYLIAGRVLLDLQAGFSHIAHPDIVLVDGGNVVVVDSFSQNRIDAQLFGEYRFSDVFGVNSTIRYTTALEDRLIPAGLGPTGGTDNLAFQRWEAYLGARLFW